MNGMEPWTPHTEDDVWADLSWLDELRQNGKTRLAFAALTGVDLDTGHPVDDTPDCGDECECD